MSNAFVDDNSGLSCFSSLVETLADFKLEVFPEVIALELAQGGWTYKNVSWYLISWLELINICRVTDLQLKVKGL